MKKMKANPQPSTAGKMGILAIERRKHPRFVVELPLCALSGGCEVL
jgi:hypothetical protein